MAHKTLIDGTAYQVKGGRTLIDGTGYKIKKGRTLIGGTGYDIPFFEATIQILWTKGIVDRETKAESIDHGGSYECELGSGSTEYAESFLNIGDSKFYSSTRSITTAKTIVFTEPTVITLVTGAAQIRPSGTVNSASGKIFKGTRTSPGEVLAECNWDKTIFDLVKAVYSFTIQDGQNIVIDATYWEPPNTFLMRGFYMYVSGLE